MDNRREARNWYKRFRKKLMLGSWKDFRSTQITKRPYINHKKRAFRALLASGMSYKAARREMNKDA